MNTFISELVGAVGQVVLFALIPFIWWLITARKKENFFKWIGLKKVKSNGGLLKAVVIAVIALIVYGFMTNFLANKFAGDVTTAGSGFAGKGMAGIPLAFVYGLIRTGLSEEILFRGFILKRISGKFGFMAGNVIQAIAFGLVHGVPFGAATHNVGVTVALTILPAIVGFILGWVNEKKASGSIVPSWMLHGITNVIVTCMAL
ncbi:MAG: CPBP family intramembrane metalloprotease [Saccharofermentans sp.]|nr:CPBP family intramembrane metalloprotease [Saccharofermentans sp.]